MEITPNKEGPNPGVYIAARNINNNGTINGPRVDIITENYEGRGEVSAFNKNKSKWWENSWFQVIGLLGSLAGIMGLYLYF